MSKLRSFLLGMEPFRTDENGRRLFAPPGVFNAHLVPDQNTEARLGRQYYRIQLATFLFELVVLIVYFREFGQTLLLNLLSPSLGFTLIGIAVVAWLLRWLLLCVAAKGLPRASDRSWFDRTTRKLAKRHPQELAIAAIACSGLAMFFVLFTVLLLHPIALLLIVIFAYAAFVFGYAYTMTCPPCDD